MKKRLDIILLERGLVATRSNAQAIIMAGQVSSETKVLDKPGQAFDESIIINIKQSNKYVSRAGDKLASAAGSLNIVFNDLLVLDVGSSTGGFTDYALQDGALKVFCVDVGTNQLAHSLRIDPRTVVFEKIDIRSAVLPEKADIAVIDVSFISVTKILHAVRALIKPKARILVMVKPQFEAGKPLADKYRGVIPLGSERDSVLAEVKLWLVSNNFKIVQEIGSAVPGAEGNVEHFMVIVSDTEPS